MNKKNFSTLIENVKAFFNKLSLFLLKALSRIFESAIGTFIALAILTYLAHK